MRLDINITPKAEFPYDSQYHSKLRGRLWRALEGTEYYDLHDKQRPIGWAFSNPYPPRPPSEPIQEGEDMWLTVSAREENVLGHLANNLSEHPDIDIGKMQFTVENVSVSNVDAGRPGESGVLKTQTGVLMRMDKDECEEHGIEYTGSGDSYTYWTSDHPLEAFIEGVEKNTAYKHGLFEGNELPSPLDVEYDLFNNGVKLIDTHAVPVRVGNGDEQVFVVSSWELGYSVVDADHRRFLNLLLDTGVGEGNGLGFGFVTVENSGGMI